MKKASWAVVYVVFNAQRALDRAMERKGREGDRGFIYLLEQVSGKVGMMRRQGGIVLLLLLLLMMMMMMTAADTKMDRP